MQRRQILLRSSYKKTPRCELDLYFVSPYTDSIRGEERHVSRPAGYARKSKMTAVFRIRINTEVSINIILYFSSPLAVGLLIDMSSDTDIKLENQPRFRTVVMLKKSVYLLIWLWDTAKILSYLHSKWWNFKHDPGLFWSWILHFYRIPWAVCKIFILQNSMRNLDSWIK